MMCLACGARGGRGGEMVHPRAQHPSCQHGRTQCAAGLTNVCYISMKADGREAGREGGTFTFWMKNKREDILVLDSWCKHHQRDEIV